MKKQLIKAISKKVSSLFLAVFILTAVSQKAFASNISNPADKAEVSYVGSKDKNLVFNVNYKNETAQAFQLIIKNGQNEIIYVKQFDAKPLNKTLLFSEVPDNCKLTFLIKTNKEEVAQSFEINTQVRTIQEYLVKGI